MPPLGKMMGNVDFSGLFINLSGTPYPSLAAAKAAGAATINYGMFINNVIQFVIIAIVVFMMVRSANRLHVALYGPPPKQEPKTKDCPFCMRPIPIKAVRCPECTSPLEPQSPAQASG